MVLFKDKKVAFLLPPKTGTTTAVKFFRNSNQATIFEGIHLEASVAVKQAPEIVDYKIYCFLRNPAERFISGLLMLKEHYFINNFLNALSKESVTDCKDFVDVYFLRNRNKIPSIIFCPQHIYFDGLNVTALDFDDYEAELKSATKDLGLDDFSIVWENEGTHEKKKELAKKVVSFVKKEYPKDCELWLQKFGKSLD
jgi:hypothetical protein